MPKPLRSRIAVTAGVVIGLWFTLLIPSPFINTEVTEQLGALGAGVSATYGPCSLGLTPFFISFVIVELIVLLWKPYRRLGDVRYRAKMWKASVILGVFLSFVYGWGQALALEIYGEGGLSAGLLVPGPGVLFKALFTVTAVAGTAVWFIGASVISRRGLGNGFIVVILADLLSVVPGRALDLWDWWISGSISPVGILIHTAVALVGFAAALFVLKRFSRRPDPNLPIRVPTCGTVPLELALGATVIPATLANLGIESMRGIAGELVPGTVFFLIVVFLGIVLMVPLFSFLFYRRRQLMLTSEETISDWRKAQLLSGGILVGTVLYLSLGQWLLRGTILPSSLGLLMVAAVVLDLLEEMRARWRVSGGVDLVPLVVHYDVINALEAHADLEAPEGTVIQGLHYRSMTYLFGPFVPLKILGPDRFGH